ncbi:hypothetical protein B9P99_03710 [Candidatus Marsarchaeota G1 archaeon OSP_B]|uniref:Uncharacterized protein n=2 Tax=Candidatus Marsarchaeota group 1 TaxID=2203770 RepID=A0A2R6AL43_9ARCH|nr:MAG: hypothetical protein B9Q00_09760 [Candidatus Marsarchaeota G1 archaeon OSP_C]PSN91964.1 MAG: hypothetical protein B9P99_03710 [Candidatus Marsarchaeota G1 archaeon OSP_B]
MRGGSSKTPIFREEIHGLPSMEKFIFSGGSEGAKALSVAAQKRSRVPAVRWGIHACGHRGLRNPAAGIEPGGRSRKPRGFS